MNSWRDHSRKSDRNPRPGEAALPVPDSTSAFAEELGRGLAAYSESLGNWWHRRAVDPAHRRAYRRIAEYIHASFPRPPRVILDFACGEGHLLLRLRRIYPSARLIGLDGSPMLLQRARTRLLRPARSSRLPIIFIRTSLPNFALRSRPADLVLYTFPNLVPAGKQREARLISRYLGRRDRFLAERLARWRDPGVQEECTEDVAEALLRGRLVSLNLRRLLKEGGICLRVEYAGCRRDELSASGLARAEFEEGALEHEIGEVRPRHWFRVLASSFCRSSVIEDVYQQSGGPFARGGGYSLTVLRAL